MSKAILRNMTTSKKSQREKASQTDWARVNRQCGGGEPIDCSEISELDEDWFERADFCDKDDVAVNVILDRCIVEFFEKQFPKYRSKMNQVLSMYKEKSWTLRANSEIADPVLLNASFNKDMFEWFKRNGSDCDNRINQVLRDFMERYSAERGSPG